ncbi:hypothetical protein G7Y89_g9816 [Cudoniella acicularis]|uniref:Uncharacterized protein n=1 Tax=Cudoniella acicularis TaxID=354080 RepID=A0A8H4RDY3_9HELO|nr:hypothetical protein G7Y89_g9816 [Cudoniella acicularis]
MENPKHTSNGSRHSSPKKCSGDSFFTSTEIITSYKSHITGLSSLIILFEELLERAQTTECELAEVKEERESKIVEIVTITAALAKLEIELESCKREREEACSGLEVLKGEKARVVEEFERERVEFREKVRKDEIEIKRLFEELKIVQEERDVAFVERDRFRKEKEKFVEEFKVERVESTEKETKSILEIRKWKEAFERLEEIRQWREKFELIEKESETIRVDLKETVILLEKERERFSSSSKTILEFKEQIEVLKRSWKSATESEERSHEEAESARKEARKADHERDEFQAKFFEIQEFKLREGESHEQTCEDSKLLIKAKADLAEYSARLETYLPPKHLRGRKFCIDKVIYGGKVLDNVKVLQEIQEAAEGGRSLKPTDRSCGAESWGSKTHGKTFTVAYFVDGKGPMRYVSAQEGVSVRFH